MGPKEEAKEIKERLKTFLLEELKLELSQEKTLITHAISERARFLGYDISVNHCNNQLTRGRRTINGGIALRIPKTFVEERSRLYMRKGKPFQRYERVHDSDYSIMSRYQSEYRGFVQYYRLADNLNWLDKLRWTMQSSLLKTLANKFKSTVAKMARKYRANVMTVYGPRKCLEVVVTRKGKKPLIARFGGIPLKKDERVKIQDQQLARPRLGSTELLQRLLAETCEGCGSNENIEVHHIRRLADLNKKGRKKKPDWVKLMAARRRKTLVLCRICHNNIHAGRPLRNKTE